MALVSLAAVGAVAWWGFRQRTSPGPLHPTHAALKELRGNAGCDACHGKGVEGEAMKTGMTQSCLACHEPIKAQIDTASGIHGALAKDLRNACEKCHREHLGMSIALISDNSFRLAGIAQFEKYDHAHTPGGYHLEGKHLELQCQNCHKTAYETMLGKGEKRYLGLAQTCVPCHEDFHKGELGNDCAKCHGQQRPFKESPLFHHPDTFPLNASHRAAKCIDCHTEKGVFTGLKTDCVSCHQKEYDKTTKPSHIGTGIKTDCATCHAEEKWDTRVKFAHPETFQLLAAHAKPACADCHKATTYTKLSTDCASCHRADFDNTKEPNHATAGIKTTCADCHTVETWKTASAFKHPAAFPLSGAHATTTCTQCHAPGKRQEQVAAFVKQPSCAACHPSPHQQATLRAVANLQNRTGDTCAACHQFSDSLWGDSSPRMTAELHAATGFPLAPPHESIDCAKCHTGYVPHRAQKLPADQYKEAFPGRSPQQCEACHADPHDGQFLSAPSRGRCTACHNTSRFTPTQFGEQEHAKCRFPLDGAHTAVACAACHKLEEKGSVKVRRFIPTTTVCADCHKDVHNGAFDTPTSPAKVHGKTGCARCHATKDFREVAWTADEHKQWTGSALLGKHATTKCDDCHRRATPGARPGRSPAFAKAPEACAECHADVHAGQFSRNNTTDCAKCHQSTESFKTLVFNHARDSRFALDENHAKLACDACHKPYDTPAGPLVRYKPLGTQCSDCHGVVPQAKKPTGGNGP